MPGRQYIYEVVVSIYDPESGWASEPCVQTTVIGHFDQPEDPRDMLTVKALQDAHVNVAMARRYIT